MNYYLTSKLFRQKKKKTDWLKFILLVCLCFFTGEVISQSFTIQGQIVSTDGEELIGVNILNENTGEGTSTDFDGNYSIEANSGDWLVYSYIGYTTERRQAQQEMDGNVVLSTAADVLDEIIVVGYGTLRSSKVSTSVSKLSSDELNNSTFARVDQAMAGKIAGVHVQEVSGSPGAGMAIKIRGVSSITNSNSPLYVVDGFPISGGLETINPKDIESIEILKDAASSAIYGSRGSNGVVLITTKQGQSGKPRINFSTSYGLQQQLSEVGVLNRDQYIEFAIEERTNSAIYQGIDPSTLTTRPPSHQYSIDPLWISNPESFPDNNWQDIINRVAPISSNQLSISGKTDNFKYYSSFNYLDQQGIIMETDFSRFSFRTNMEANLSGILDVGINLNLTSSTRNDPDMNSNQSAVSRSLLVAPIVELDQQIHDKGYYPYHASFYLNPITLATEIDNKIDNQRLIANPYIQIQPLQNWFIKASGGMDIMNVTTDLYRTNNVNRGVGGTGSANIGKRKNYLTELTSTYATELGDFGFDLLAGYSFQKETYDAYSIAKAGFPDDDIKTLNAGTVINSASSTISEWALISYFGRINLDYKGRYILTSSLRRDGSSRFGTNKKWGLFPSLSVGWNVDSEPFFREGVVSNLKLRASYGATGNNNIGNYVYSAQISNSNYLNRDGSVAPGARPGGFSNPDLGWESTNILDFGVDVGFFNGRINTTIDYYISDTRDLLLSVPIPGITGNTSAIQNIGRVENKGVELELKTHNLTGAFDWISMFSISHNKNTVKELGPTGAPIFGSSSGYVLTITEIGRSIGEYYMFETDGVFMNEAELESHPTYKRQEPGDLKFVDQNGDGMITLEDDRTHVGSNLPKFNWGFTNQFSFKNLAFSFFLDGQYGNKVLNRAKAEHGQSRGNVHDYWLNRWRSPEDPGDGKTPRAAVTDNLTTVSDFWLADATFWRIKNISLAYTIPDQALVKTRFINNARIVFTVDNVIMFDDYYNKVQTGTWSNSALVPGVEYNNTYPLARTFNLGIDLTF